MKAQFDHNAIREPETPPRRTGLSRRAVLGGAAGVIAAGVGLDIARHRGAWPKTPAGLDKVRLAWNPVALCLAPVVLAQNKGIFARHGLDVELISYAGSTDQLLESMSTGKADAGVGMILRWIKPLEQGFDVKLLGGTHGGCIRMLGSRRAGISEDPASLRGKAIGLAEITGASRNAFAVLLKYHGLDPDRDVEWRQFPQPLLGEALRKGEVQAIADSDPILYLEQKASDGDLIEVVSNLSHPWQDRVCCVVGSSGAMLRENPRAAKGLMLAMADAASLCSTDPHEAALAFRPYAKSGTLDDLVAILKSQTHARHPIGRDMTGDIQRYAAELRAIGVMKPTTDPQRFAANIVSDVLA